jgi:HlyD family secretion protein
MPIVFKVFFFVVTLTGAMMPPLHAQNAEEPKPPAVTIIRAEKRVLIEKVPATGNVVAREEVLISPEIEGLRILELLVDEGEQVKQGQVLARLSPDVIQTQMAQNDAALNRARAADVEARSALDRARSLTKTGASSEAILDQRTAAAQSAKAQIEELAARNRELQWRLSRTEIKAPVAGLVTRRMARIGQIASGMGEPMFRLVRNGELDLDAEVTEQNLGRLALSQQVQVTFANDVAVSGQVRLIAPQVESNSRIGRVKIALAADPRTRTGNFGRAEVMTAKREGVAIPLSSVLFSKGEALAQVLENGRVVTRRLKTGLVDAGSIEIMEGIREGEIVVLRAGSFLRDGDKARGIPLPVTAVPPAVGGNG